MEIRLLACIILLFGLTGCSFKNQEQQQGVEDEFHSEFVENFNDSTSIFFRHGTGGKGADFTWKMGTDSPTEPGTKVLSFKIDPEDIAGAGRGPEVISNKLTHY